MASRIDIKKMTNGAPNNVTSKNTDTTTHKKIQLKRDNGEDSDDSLVVETPAHTTKKISKQPSNSKPNVTPAKNTHPLSGSQKNTSSSNAPSSATTGRHTSQAKKESLESLKNRVPLKESVTKHNGDRATTHSPAVNPYEEQNRSLAAELDKCRQLIAYKDSLIQVKDTENFKFREYTNALELEVCK
jgi:hypothetical protein